MVALATPVAVQAQSQMEMNASTLAELEKADRQLNALYGKLMKDNQDDTQYYSDLREAQRAWLKFVEFHMKVSFPLKEGEDPRVVYGSVYPADYSILKTGLIRERIAQLKQLAGEE